MNVEMPSPRGVSNLSAWRWPLLFGACLAALAIWAGLRINVGQIVETARTLDVYEAAIGVLAFTATQSAFAARWWMLIDKARRPEFITTVDYSLIGGMLNAVLPMRAGDVARAFILSRRHAIRLGDAGGAIALERLADASTVLCLGAILALRLVLPERAIDSLLVLFITLLATASAAAIVLRFVGFGRLRQLGINLLPAFLADRASNAIEGLSEVTTRLKDVRVLSGALAAHVAGWLFVILALAVFIPALNVKAPPLDAALSVLLLTSLGGIVLQLPAGIGSWHMLAAGALTYWGAPLEVGLAYAIIVHGLGIAVPVVLGIVSAFRVGNITSDLRMLRAKYRGRKD